MKILKLKNGLIKFISCFIFSKRKRRKFLSKFLYVAFPNNNKIFIVMPDGREKQLKHNYEWLKVIFRGSNNILKISPDINSRSHISLIFDGNNSCVEIFGLSKASDITCSLGTDCHFLIEKNSFVARGLFCLDDEKSEILIGKNCALSWGLTFMAGDLHTILDEKKVPSNYPESIIIKDHVWIGCNVTITKGVVIEADNVIGTNSVVTKSFSDTHTIIAGNPAKIVKRGISWDLDRIGDYKKQYQI